MDRVLVRLPSGIAYPNAGSPLEVEAETVREALERAVAREPRLEGRVFTPEGGFASAVFVNGVSAKRTGGMETLLHDGDVLTLMPPIAGG